MEFVDNVLENEYESFVYNHKKAHFMESYYFGNVSKLKNFIPHYVGLRDNGVLVGAALLLEKKLPMGYSYFYSPRGYVIDFNDQELLEKFTLELKKYAKAMKAIFIKIDPDIKRHDLNSDGVIVGNSNQTIINGLLDMGYLHKGFNKEFTNEQPRFTFRLDLSKSKEEIFGGFSATTRKILNKGNQYGFVLYKNEEARIEDFYYTMMETAKRENLSCAKMEYYKTFYEELHKHDMSDLYVVKINIDDLRKRYEEMIRSINENIEKIDAKNSSDKLNNKKNDLLIQIDHVKKEMNNLNDITDDEVILSSIITAKYGDKVWTVHGGNSTILRELNANYYLYYEIISSAKEEEYKMIDFFGCSGNINPDKSSSIYGLHNFKKKLGGEYTEFIGEFDLVTNRLMYKIFNILVPLRRKIVKWKLRCK